MTGNILLNGRKKGLQYGGVVSRLPFSIIQPNSGFQKRAYESNNITT